MTTKADLYTFITAESHRADLSAEFDNFIRRAEQRIAREVRAVEMIQHTVLDDGDRIGESCTFELPLDFLEDISIIYGSDDIPLEAQHGNGKPITNKLTMHDIFSKSECGPVNSYALTSTDSGDSSGGGPKIIFKGKPPLYDPEVDLFNFFTVIYYARPLALTAEDSENNILTNHETLYISASLFELYRHTQDLELAQAQLDVFADAATKLNAQAGRFIGGTRMHGNQRTIGNPVTRSY